MSARKPLVLSSSGAPAELPSGDEVLSTIGFPTDYISGLTLSWSSTTSVTIGTGSCWNPIDSKLATINSPITYTNASLSASTFYYIYLTSGNATLTVSTTAPTSYQGTAFQDGSNQRYLGCFLTTAGGLIHKFIRIGNKQFYQTGAPSSAQFRVLGSGVATTSTSVSCSGCIPPTSNLGIISFTNTSATQRPLISNSACGTPPSNLFTVISLTPSVSSFTREVELPLVSQAFLYAYASSPSNGLFADVLGFVEDR